MAYMPLLPYSKTLSKIIVLMIVAQFLQVRICAIRILCSDSSNHQTALSFYLEKLFYPNNAARQKDVNEFGVLKTQLEEQSILSRRKAS
jgi:hypothetical protein